MKYVTTIFCLRDIVRWRIKKVYHYRNQTCLFITQLCKFLNIKRSHQSLQSTLKDMLCIKLNLFKDLSNKLNIVYNFWYLRPSQTYVLFFLRRLSLQIII